MWNNISNNDKNNSSNYNKTTANNISSVARSVKSKRKVVRPRMVWRLGHFRQGSKPKWRAMAVLCYVSCRGAALGSVVTIAVIQGEEGREEGRFNEGGRWQKRQRRRRGRRRRRRRRRRRERERERERGGNPRMNNSVKWVNIYII